jgi:hypothetical protein
MMVEIDIEEILFSGMGNEKPVVREPWANGEAMVLFDDYADILSFTSTGIAERLVYRVGDCTEFDVEDLFVGSGMNNDKPVLRMAVNAGGSREIPIGARPTWPGDTLHLIDFEEDVGVDFSPGLSSGLVMVVVNSRQSVLLGSITDSFAGYNGLGTIKFLIYGQFKDLLA